MRMCQKRCQWLAWRAGAAPPGRILFYLAAVRRTAPHRTVVDGCLGIICGGRLVEKERAGSMPPPALLLLLLRVIMASEGAWMDTLW